MGKWFKPTKDDIQNIISLYKSGLGVKPIARKYSCGDEKIRKILKDNNIEFHIKGSVSPYHFNEHFLDSLDSADKFYFLGWAYSDGNVDSKENLFKIGLKSEDKETLCDLNALLESNREIKVENNVATLSLTSQHFKNRLIELGCIPCKSNVLEWPSFIPDKFLKDFIRGYFDGDGGLSITLNKSGWYKGSFSITSTKEFNIKLKQELERVLGIKYINLRKAQHSSANILTINNREEIIKVLDWLYKDCTIKLNRKYRTYLIFKESINNIIKDRSKTHYLLLGNKDKILDRYNSGESCGSISRDLNICKSTICRFIKKYQTRD